MKIFSTLNNPKLDNTIKSLGFILIKPEVDILKNIDILTDVDIFLSDTIDNLFWIYYSRNNNIKKYIYLIGLNPGYKDVIYYQTPEDVLGQLVSISPLNLINSKDRIQELEDENKALQILCKNLIFYIYDNSENSIIDIDKKTTEKLSMNTGVSVKTDDDKINLTFTSKKVGKHNVF